MTRERIQKHLEIMEAFAKGNDVQIWNSTSKNWLIINDPEFFEESFYRVKPEPKLVSFTFEDDLVGRVVTPKGLTLREMITVQTHTGVAFYVNDSCTHSYSDLLEHYNFSDGSPCGKVQE